METPPYPDKVPGSRAWDRERGEYYGEEHHFHGGASPCVVSINNGGGGRDRGDRGRDDHGGEEFPPTASLPLTGTEQMLIKQYATPWNRWRNAVVNVISFITSFFRTGYSWGKASLVADTPTTTLFTTPPSATPYLLTLNFANTVANGSTSTATYTLTATSADGTSFPKTGTVNLNSAGSGTYVSVGVILQPNSLVTFQLLGGTYSGGAQYAFFVSAFPLVAPQALANNVMY